MFLRLQLSVDLISNVPLARIPLKRKTRSYCLLLKVSFVFICLVLCFFCSPHIRVSIDGVAFVPFKKEGIRRKTIRELEQKRRKPKDKVNFCMTQLTHAESICSFARMTRKKGGREACSTKR